MYKRENLFYLLKKFDYRNTDLKNKKVLLRACLNVATDEEGIMIDDTRYKEALPVIKDLSNECDTLFIVAHLGRPKEKERKFSFWNIAEILQKDLGNKFEVVLTDDLDGDFSQSEKRKKVFLIENIRFFSGEKSKDEIERKEFAKKLASLADIFVNDAFPDYNESASTFDVAKFLPSYLGSKFIDEVESLSEFSNPARPFVSILGGAKLSEKLDAMRSLLEVSDKVLVGGAIAYTILKAKGWGIGNSLFEEEKLEVAKEMLEKFQDKIVLPVDHQIVSGFKNPNESEIEFTNNEEIPEGKIAIDIGPKTVELFKLEIKNAKSILWNGPMGVYEWENSSNGTKEIGLTVSSNKSAFKLAGGGDSISAINKFGISGIDHISTGGGAMLSFLAYDNFPTLDVILDQNCN